MACALPTFVDAFIMSAFSCVPCPLLGATVLMSQPFLMYLHSMTGPLRATQWHVLLITHACRALQAFIMTARLSSCLRLQDTVFARQSRMGGLTARA